METIEYNLLREKWIRVMLPDCRVEQLSLPDALARAHEYRALAGELPTQDVAVLRLMLAALHTTFSRLDEKGRAAPLETPRDARERWTNLWALGRFPDRIIRDDLMQWADRFWLFHPERPFYQVLAAQSGTTYGAAKLNGEMSESNNKLRLFPACSGKAKSALSYDEAARWLLYVNGFDDTSSKRKGKDLPSPGTGWLGKLGLIYAEGANLFETLMLNLVLEKDICFDDGEEIVQKPVWALKTPRSGERVAVALPNNQAELLTLQSRRILLERKDGMVVGYSLLGGDFFEKINAFEEQMTVWRRVDRKKNTPVFDQPRRHDATRQMWRDFALIAGNPEAQHIPGVVEWVSKLKRKGALEKAQIIHFRIASVQYGDKDFFVTDVFCDALGFHAELLGEQADNWVRMIRLVIEKCEKGASIVGRLADGLCKAAGGSNDGEAQQAKERYFFLLDPPFRQWLMSLDPGAADGDEEMAWAEAERVMKKTAYDIARQLGADMVAQAGAVAFAGRSIEECKAGKRTLRRYTSPEVYNSFLYWIGECFEIKAVKEALHG